MIRKTFVEDGERQVARVMFQLPSDIWANAIYLVGDFNAWHRTSHPFQRDPAGNWTITVDLEAGRAFQFRYLCDGSHWLNDMHADAYVVNPYGSDNFVVITDPLFKPYCDERKTINAGRNDGNREAGSGAPT